MSVETCCSRCDPLTSALEQSHQRVVAVCQIGGERRDQRDGRHRRCGAERGARPAASAARRRSAESSRAPARAVNSRMSSTLWNEVSNCSASDHGAGHGREREQQSHQQEAQAVRRRRSFGRNRRIENAEVLALVAGFNRLGQPRVVGLPRQDVIVFLGGAVVALDLDVAFAARLGSNRTASAARRSVPADPFPASCSRVSSSSKSVMLRLLRGSASRSCGALCDGLALRVGGLLRLEGGQIARALVLHVLLARRDLAVGAGDVRVIRSCSPLRSSSARFSCRLREPFDWRPPAPSRAARRCHRRR